MSAGRTRGSSQFRIAVLLPCWGAKHGGVPAKGISIAGRR